MFSFAASEMVGGMPEHLHRKRNEEVDEMWRGEGANWKAGKEEGGREEVGEE